MPKLVLSEKPYLSRCVAPLLADQFGDDVLYLHVLPPVRFADVYPRGLTWADVPIIDTPRRRIRHDTDIGWAPLVHRGRGDDGRPQLVAVDLTGEEIEARIAATMPSDILVMVDQDHRGKGTAAEILRQLHPAADAEDFFVPSIDFVTTASAEIARAVQNAVDGVTVLRLDDPLVQADRIKRLFDWTWNINSAIVLGDAVRAAGGSSVHILSKNMLLALYVLRAMENETGVRDGDFFLRLQSHPGSGRFPPSTVGSPASRQPIVENLAAMNLIDRRRQDQAPTVALTPAGRRLLDGLLHKDCFDPDQPARLEAWMTDGDAAVPKVERYLRTFFGKQKRFLKHRLSAA